MTLKLFGTALCGVLAYGLLRQRAPEFAPLAELGCAAVLFFLILGELRGLADAVRGALETVQADAEYPEILLKVLGTALVSSFAADAARDNGMQALAGKIEFAGRILMLALALPVFRALLQLVSGIGG